GGNDGFRNVAIALGHHARGGLLGVVANRHRRGARVRFLHAGQGAGRREGGAVRGTHGAPPSGALALDAPPVSAPAPEGPAAPAAGSPAADSLSREIVSWLSCRPCSPRRSRKATVWSAISEAAVGAARCITSC